MKLLKAIRYFMCDLGIKGQTAIALIFNALRWKIIQFCDAVIMLWEPDWEPYTGL